MIKWTETLLAIKDLKEYDRNPRHIKSDAFNNLVNSLKEDGYHQRLIVNLDGTIIGGHQRKRALKEAGYKQSDKIAVLQPDRQLEPQEFKRLNIRDNLPYGEFDMDILGSDFEVEELLAWGMPEDMLPIVPEIIEGLTDDDAIPETPLDPTTRLGDMYIMGNHKLLCGDSTDIGCVDRLMGGLKADMVFTDPPYGMNLKTDYTSHDKPKSYEKSKKYDSIIGDGDDFTPVLINTIFASFGYCKEIFLFGADYYSDLIPKKNDGSWIVWDKRAGIEDKEWQTSEFELCWSKSRHHRKIARITWNGVIGMPTDDMKKRQHTTQKPKKLPEWFFNNWGNPGDLVVDLYGGAGSTMIACEKTNRKCYMIELDPKYCDVIVKRWENYTGLKAES